MTLTLGIDPGLSGALALYDPTTDTLVIHDVPTFQLKRNGKMKADVDLCSLAALADDLSRNYPQVYIEQVWARQGESPSSSFAFGKVYGCLLMAVAACKVRLEHVTSAKWKKALAVPAEKDGARARASALLPQHSTLWRLKSHHNRAEAALIALYGSRRAS
jgi:Holliday junction resolvasome RuvABC endonuclease subunit